MAWPHEKKNMFLYKQRGFPLPFFHDVLPGRVQTPTEPTDQGTARRPTKRLVQPRGRGRQMSTGLPVQC